MVNLQAIQEKFPALTGITVSKPIHRYDGREGIQCLQRIPVWYVATFYDQDPIYLLIDDQTTSEEVERQIRTVLEKTS